MKFNFLCWVFCLVIFAPATVVFGQTESGGRPAKTFSRAYGRTGVLLDAGVYRQETEATANPALLNQWESATLIYDFNAGYITDNHVYFGAEYSSRADNQISVDSSAGASSGLGAGYFSARGFHIRSYYLFNTTFGDYGNGAGFKIDLGYMMNLNAGFFLGASLSYRQTTFKSNSTIFVYDPWTRKETYPLLTLGVIFN